MRTPPEVAGEVVALRARIEGWRRVKKSGSAMPSELWDAAVGLARDHGVYVASRQLGVDYGKLKGLLAAADAERIEAPLEFVELPASFNAASALAVVEMHRADGASFRAELPGGRDDVLALATTFLGGGA